MFRSSIIVTLSLLWLSLVAAGLWHVWRYEGTPGKAASAPTHWPAAGVMKQTAAGMTLVMVVHPHCPCSHASLEELAQLMARSEGRISATVLFVRYAGVSEAWARTDLWHLASSIPSVHAVVDPNGALAQRFGAYTSGQAYVYDASGRLLFSGGLTAARGHEGDNDGLSAALALVRGQTPKTTHTPVFGCPLFPAGAVKKASRCRS